MLIIKQPVARKKLSQSIEEELERMIRQGELQEGDALPSERELMQAFSVGRPSVRDALAGLARKGLVKISSGERTRVTRPSPENIISELSVMSKDFLNQPDGLRYFEQLRKFFESSLVRYAAQHATEDDVAELRLALELNRAAIPNPQQFKKTDANFHRVIAGIPKNPIFLAVHQALVDWLIEVRKPSTESTDVVLLNQKSFDAHATIFKCIENRDPDGADAALSKHINYVFEHIYDTPPVP